MEMTTATEYTEEWLQEIRPQPMYDKNINRIIKDFHDNGVKNGCPHEDELYEVFKKEFDDWINRSTFNSLTGFDAYSKRDICIGCTQFIDNLYMKHGYNGLMTFEGDYRYHWRLNNDIKYITTKDLMTIGFGRFNIDGRHKPLLIALPFPKTGDIYLDMDVILNKCYELNIPVHIDGAWITCCRDITFNFNHPAIHSFAISLSKGLALGWNRIGVRYARTHQNDSISLMNDYHMNCRSLTWLGLHFLRSLEPDYFWKKYEDAYNKICKDFNLLPTKAIHLARLQDGTSRGVRPLLRYLADK